MTDRFNLGPPPLLAYADVTIDRAAHRRNDTAALENTPGAAAYCIAGESVVLRKAGDTFDPLFRLDEARALGVVREQIFLGLANGVPRFALALDPAAAETLKAQGRYYVIDLRSIAVQGLLASDQLPALAEGKAMLLCGDVKYFATQPWPFPMSLMIGCHAKAISTDITVDTTELEDARWFSREDAAAMLTRRHAEGFSTPPPVAIAHHIIRAWVEGKADVG